MAIKQAPGSFPHVKWVDLRQDGILVEVAVVKEDDFGNLYYFELSKLDNIDKNRIFRILRGRAAGQFELWDLLSQTTLNNGMNALTYFHQLVKVLSPSGKISTPRQGEIGVAFNQPKPGVVDTNAPTPDGSGD